MVVCCHRTRRPGCARSSNGCASLIVSLAVSRIGAHLIRSRMLSPTSSGSASCDRCRLRGCNDANNLRVDPIFKMRMTSLPRTTNCVRNRPSRGWRTCQCPRPSAHGRAMVDLYASLSGKFPSASCSISTTRSTRFTRPAVRLFNAHYDEYGFQPIVVFDGEGRFVTAVLRPAKRPVQGDPRLPAPPASGDPDQPAQHPDMLRADSHYAAPK